ncbi:MAG: phosphate ABC transporter permease PstA [Deltaproteobacteria bacterium]|jgi:phosphate transport system permease protein|nr:phosphate ABC transporter permease PstA [Deltaproteobacteria bacterium]
MFLNGFSPADRQRRQTLALTLIRAAGFGFLGITGLLVVYLIYQGLAIISWDFLTQYPRDSMTAGGIFPAIAGTLGLAAGSMLVAIPLGFGAAIYLSDYARPGPLLTVIRLGVNNLAAVPSVVFGLFGLAVFVGFLGFGRSLLSGCLTLGILTLPTVTAAAEEALRQTPQSFREAALALGANRWQAIRQVILPAALPGMLTGAILALGRAAGETAPIIFTASAALTLAAPESVFSEVMALPTHIFNLATNGTHIEATLPQQFGTCLVLIVLVLGLSLFAIILRARLRKGRKW